MTTKTMLHRLFLAGMLTTAAFAAHAQETITLKLADQFPLTHIASREGSQALISALEEISGGAIKVQHFPAEQIAKAGGLLDAVRNRVTDLALVGVVYNTDKLPLTSVAELPGLYDDSVVASQAFTEYLKEDLTQREYLPLGVRPLWGTVLPPYQLMFAAGGDITDVSELEGQKMRVAGATGEMIANALGAVPVKIPASDLYLALQRGTVNGAIWNAPSAFGYKIEEVLASVSNNASLGSITFALLVNEDVWQSLSEENRALIEEAVAEARVNFSLRFEENLEEAYIKMEKAGVNVFALPQETRAVISERLAGVRASWVEQVSDRGLPALEMLNAFTTRLKK